jgi:hypothetical protein
MKLHWALALALCLAACAPQGGVALMAPQDPVHAPADPSGCNAGAENMQRVELIFGARWKGGNISPAMWRRFLAEDVTPRFPDGLSTFDIQGQWRNAKGEIVKLPSRVLLIWYKPSPDASAKIDAIRASFNRRYAQESVMRIDGQNCVSF